MRRWLREVESGQTLVEAVVVFGLVSMILTGLVAATTIALSRIQFAQHQAQARDYAQEGQEWIRGERDKGWVTFVTKPGYSYCFNTSPITSWPATGLCGGADFSLTPIFKREATLTFIDSPANQQVEVKLTVSWQEGGQTHKSEQITYITNWR